MKAANGFKAQAQLFRALSHPVRLRIGAGEQASLAALLALRVRAADVLPLAGLGMELPEIL